MFIKLKRMGHPQVHSPIAGLMAKYILGLSEFSQTLTKIEKNDSSYIDLHDYELPGC